MLVDHDIEATNYDDLFKNNTPHATNFRHSCKKVMDTYADAEPWFGIEQEYMLMDPETNRPYGWPRNGAPEPQGKYYCGIGADKIYGRDIMEAHYRACLFAGIRISGINAEAAPSQYEFQVGPCEGVSVSDELWVARYILERVAEEFGVGVSLHPKPVDGDWNGAGCHTNYSTARMREDGGLDVMDEAIEKMSLKHFEHLEVYGDDNDLRLTGRHETGHIAVFSYGFGNRGASIRIPRHVAMQGKGYMEDRRPASNIDPYKVTAIIVESSLGPEI
ncbi:glutamate--ammonia ligase [Apophysomyces ossiformis]|uniref:Glutamine synthetase n=1 Tax=Apophysomyces ossiformis TaxID=679940 RepID=A0A8H7BVX7_9FUNG|nr:glutamate--ammonia ligase [Apophysomyces ossiformis]